MLQEPLEPVRFAKNRKSISTDAMAKNQRYKTGLLHRLKKVEYEPGAQAAFSNAEEFMVLAEFSHQKGLFAKGAAHLVFALEELSKAAYLRLKALNPHICIANLKDYFHKHQVKHDGMSRLIAVLDDTESATAAEPDEPLSDGEKFGRIVLIAVIVLVVVFMLAKRKEAHRREGLDDDAKHWLGNFRQFHEQVRQAGLYVEFDEPTRTWVKPSDAIDESVFKLVLKQAQDSLYAVRKHFFSPDASAEWALAVADALADENILTRDAWKQVETQ